MGNESFRHALFRSVKSTKTRHLLLFFLTTTMLANHSGYKTSLIAPARLSIITSSLIASACSLDGRLGGCFLGVMEGLTLKWWQMKAGSIPGALQASHANTLIFLFEKFDQLFPLLKRQLGPYLKKFLRVTPNDHLLHIFAFCLLDDYIKRWLWGF